MFFKSYTQLIKNYMKKRILIVSRSFYPKKSPRSYRTTELVKEFSKQGHEVVLYTIKDEKVHNDFSKKYKVTIKDIGKLEYKRFNVRKGNSLLRALKRGLNRLLLLLFEYPDIELMFKVNKKLKTEKNYDLLISIAVPFPIHWGVAKCIRNNKKLTKTWVADCGDPYFLNRNDSFNKLFYFKYIERWFSKKADYISIPFEGLKNHFLTEFNEKYVVIPQGFNFEELNFKKDFVKNEVITFSYTGSFIKKHRDPHLFFEYLTTVKYPFKFILYNQQPEFTTPLKHKLGNRIEVRNYVPREELLIHLSQMDFLVNFEYDPQKQIPSKLIDYSIVGRPILSINNKNFKREMIDNFMHRNYEGALTLGNINNYNIKNVTKKFLELTK